MRTVPGHRTAARAFLAREAMADGYANLLAASAYEQFSTAARCFTVGLKATPELHGWVPRVPADSLLRRAECEKATRRGASQTRAVFCQIARRYFACKVDRTFCASACASLTVAAFTPCMASLTAACNRDSRARSPLASTIAPCPMPLQGLSCVAS